MSQLLSVWNIVLLLVYPEQIHVFLVRHLIETSSKNVWGTFVARNKLGGNAAHLARLVGHSAKL